MSRTFRHLFLPSFAKEFLEKYPLQTIGISTVCQLGYAVGTKGNKDIVVARKYQYDVYGFTNFMVVDTTDNHYNVNNSFWFMKWNSIEEWSNIEPNDNLTVGRIPSLGTFPNIVSTKKNTVSQIILDLNPELFILKSKMFCFIQILRGSLWSDFVKVWFTKGFNKARRSRAL